VLDGHIGAGIVTVHDHGLKRGALGDFADEVRRVEGGAIEAPYAGIEGELLGFERLNDCGRIDLALLRDLPSVRRVMSPVATS
jgi:hypothetical protein